MDKWTNHNSKVKSQNLEPSEALLLALKLYEKMDLGILQNKMAIDLGSGSGVDSLELLQRGWNVLAIDQNRTCLEQLMSDANYNTNLTIREERFESLRLPAVDLVNASFTLPFCHANYFCELWATVVNSIHSRGIFCGHLFGPEDSWASTRTDMTFHDSQQVRSLFNDFDLHSIKEIKKEGKTLTGYPKKWHIYAIVALKK